MHLLCLAGLFLTCVLGMHLVHPDHMRLVKRMQDEPTLPNISTESSLGKQDEKASLMIETRTEFPWTRFKNSVRFQWNAKDTQPAPILNRPDETSKIYEWLSELPERIDHFYPAFFEPELSFSVSAFGKQVIIN